MVSLVASSVGSEANQAQVPAPSLPAVTRGRALGPPSASVSSFVNRVIIAPMSKDFSGHQMSKYPKMT